MYAKCLSDFNRRNNEAFLPFQKGQIFIKKADVYEKKRHGVLKKGRAGRPSKFV